MERGYGNQPVGFPAYLILIFNIHTRLHFFYSSLPFVLGLVGSVYSIFWRFFFFLFLSSLLFIPMLLWSSLFFFFFV